MGTPALPTSIKKLTEGRVTALVTRLFSFCYLRNERISTTKVANITAKDNASNTVIVPPPLLWSGKASPAISRRVLYHKYNLHKSKQPVKKIPAVFSISIKIKLQRYHPCDDNGVGKVN